MGFSACVCETGGEADVGTPLDTSSPADLSDARDAGSSSAEVAGPDVGLDVPAPEDLSISDAAFDVGEDAPTPSDAYAAPDVFVDTCLSEPGCAAEGLRECLEDEAAYRECVAVGPDCLRWSATTACDGDEVCEDGVCRCLPVCDGRDCGSDGCGGDCGTCEVHEFCNGGVCLPECLSDAGCTQVGLVSCADAGEAIRTCVESLPGCLKWDAPVPCEDGWVCDAGSCIVPCLSDEGCTGPGLTVCAEEGEATLDCEEIEPGCFQWAAPMNCEEGERCAEGECVVVCLSDCAERECGGDGCGGLCGECDADEVCSGGLCLCLPNCVDRECGDDGCGGSCGPCAAGEVCSGGLCLCLPNCVDRACGDDGCGGSCGSCAAGEVCSGGLCLCLPNCVDRACGDDGCGGSCGSCAAGEVCSEGRCLCVPDCTERECGDDGCGGSCGGCPGGYVCEEPHCVSASHGCARDTDCSVGYFCHPETLSCTPAGGEGDVCALHDHCRAEFVCNSLQGVCLMPVGVGASCGVAADCLAGYDCDGSLCVPPGGFASGDACTVTSQCAAALVCNTAWLQCMPLGAFGEPCGDDSDCGVGLLCNAAYRPALCQEPAAAGAYCLLDAHCTAGLVCNDGFLFATCWPRATEVGTPCGSDRHCVDELYCASAGGCQRRGEPGEPCDDDVPCGAGLVCNTAYVPSLCQPVGASDARCLVDEHCGEGLVCNTSLFPALCRAPGVEGETCLLDQHCAAGLRCNGAALPPQCRTPGGDGALCSRDALCVDGYVCNTGADPAVCQPPAEEGAPCALSSHCRVGLVCNTAYDAPRCQRPAVEPGSPCVIGEHCADGLLCAPGGVCSPLLEGAPCSDSCATGLVCNTWYEANSDDGLARCVPPGQVGDVCTDDLDCAEVGGTGAHYACALGRCVGWTVETIAPGSLPYGETGGRPSFDEEGFISGATATRFFTNRLGPLVVEEHGGVDDHVILADVDRQLRAHVLSTYDGGDGDRPLVYRRRLLTGGDWTEEKPLPEIDVSDASALVDGAGKLHVAICLPRELWYATNASGVWHTELVSEGGGYCTIPRLALTSDGEPAIAFSRGARFGGYDEGETSVLYATRHGGRWTAVVAASSSGGRHISAASLLFSKDDAPLILRTPVLAGPLYETTNSADGWVSESLPFPDWSFDDEARDYGPAVHLDAAGHLHVLLMGTVFPAPYALTYLTNRSGRWTIAPVLGRGRQEVRSPALFVDSLGRTTAYFWARSPALDGPWSLHRFSSFCPCDASQPCDPAQEPPACVVPVGQGEACGGDIYCPSGTSCNGGYEPPRCEPPSATVGTPCAGDTHCSEGMYCSREGSCEAFGQVGEACDPVHPCLAELVCNSAGTSPLCQRPGPEGTLCLVDAHCEEGLACNTAYRPTVCRPLGEVGVSCLSDTHCTEKLFCNTLFVPAICSAPGETGALCVDDAHCADGHVCNQGLAPPICTAPGEVDTPCVVDIDCADDYVCNQGYEPRVCRPLGSVDGLCMRDVECADGLLCNQGHQPPRCVSPSEVVGDPCVIDSHCGGGMYCAPDGICALGEIGDLCVDTCAPGLVCNRWYRYEGPDGVAQCAEPGLPGDLCYDDADCGVLVGGGQITCASSRCTRWAQQRHDVPLACNPPSFLTYGADGALYGALQPSSSTSACFTDRFGATRTLVHTVGNPESGFWVGMDEHLFVHVLSNSDDEFVGSIVHGKFLVSDPYATWTEEEIPGGPLVSRTHLLGPPHEDVAMEPDGTLHIAACSDGDLWYVSNATGEWASERVEPAGGNYCLEPVIALSGGGTVHIAWGRLFANYDILYATGRAGSWSVETLFEDVGTYRGPLALLVEADGVPHALVGRVSGEVWTDLTHMSKSGGSWQPDPIPVSDVRIRVWGGHKEAMALDGTGAVHLALSTHRGAERALVYATNRGGVWSSEYVREVATYSVPAIHVNESGALRIAAWYSVGYLENQLFTFHAIE